MANLTCSVKGVCELLTAATYAQDSLPQPELQAVPKAHSHGNNLETKGT